ncbi:MAG TPA: hypothetical protein DER60_06245 [Syntrophomonas sp.]|jgi:hypothetical protein|nr:hypothetical protein [Syntrophomonas sp.]
MGIKHRFLLGAWNIGVVPSGIDDIFKNPGDLKIRWVKHKYRDRYFADPFLQTQDDRYYYILVEEYIFCEDKGRISRLTIDKNSLRLVNKETILNDKHHLSYPFIYQDHIIPEGYRSGAVYAYKPVGGDEGYQKLKLTDHALVDPTLLEYNGKYWIFATTRESREDSMSKLSIFCSDQLGEFSPHEMNPVKIDLKTARPAGHFFKHRGRLFRPVMDCEKSYGHSIRIMEVKKLTCQEYSEQEVLSLSSALSPPYNMGFHTFNVYDDCVIVDGYREYYSYLIQPILFKFKKLWLYLYTKYESPGKAIVE